MAVCNCTPNLHPVRGSDHAAHACGRCWPCFQRCPLTAATAALHPLTAALVCVVWIWSMDSSAARQQSSAEQSRAALRVDRMPLSAGWSSMSAYILHLLRYWRAAQAHSVHCGGRLCDTNIPHQKAAQRKQRIRVPVHTAPCSLK